MASLQGGDASSTTPSFQHVVETASIYTRCKVCLDLYVTLGDAVNNSRPESAVEIGFQQETSLAIIEDASVRFKAWAINIAAFQQSHLPSSLDSRLKEATEIRLRILKILADLEVSLETSLRIVTGIQPNETWDIDSLDDSDGGDGEDEENNQRSPVQTVETSELEELFSAIQSANSSLMKLSLVIRTSPTRDDYLKAASRYNLDSIWDIGHVVEKHGKSKRKQDWLLDRLGKSITRRRQFLKYREEHHWKLAQDWDSVPKDDIEKETANTIAHTKATTFVEIKVLAGQEGSDFGGSFGSQTSYEPTIMGESETVTKLTIPRPPKNAFEGVAFKYGEPFQCPYCYTEQRVKNKTAWKKHVFRDLKPYVCTFKECDLKMFKSRNEWFAHELQNHRREWSCPSCPQSFRSRSSFHSHLTSIHCLKITGSELEALILQSEEPVDRIPVSACMLCDDWEASLLNSDQDAKRLFLNDGATVEPYATLAQFRRHLGRHMEQLALFALPMHEDEGMDDDSVAESLSEDKATFPEATNDRLGEDTKSSKANIFEDNTDLATATFVDAQNIEDISLIDHPNIHTDSEDRWEVNSDNSIVNSSNASRSGSQWRKDLSGDWPSSKATAPIDSGVDDPEPAPVEESDWIFDRNKKRNKAANSTTGSEPSPEVRQDEETNAETTGLKMQYEMRIQEKLPGFGTDEIQISTKLKNGKEVSHIALDSLADETLTSTEQMAPKEAAHSTNSESKGNSEHLSGTTVDNLEVDSQDEFNAAIRREYPFNCEYCPKSFRYSKDMRQHIYAKHAQPISQDKIKINEFAADDPFTMDFDQSLLVEPVAVSSTTRGTIHFKDAIGRKFNFPFQLAHTWQGMEELVKQAFKHVDGLGLHVAKGRYDLIGPNDEIILPQVWESVIEPGWNVTMHMWPIPEPKNTYSEDNVETFLKILENKGTLQSFETPAPLRAMNVSPPPPPPPRRSQPKPTAPRKTKKGSGQELMGWLTGKPSKSKSGKVKSKVTANTLRSVQSNPSVSPQVQQDKSQSSFNFVSNKTSHEYDGTQYTIIGDRSIGFDTAQSGNATDQSLVNPTSETRSRRRSRGYEGEQRILIDPERSPLSSNEPSPSFQQAQESSTQGEIPVNLVSRKKPVKRQIYEGTAAQHAAERGASGSPSSYRTQPPVTAGGWLNPLPTLRKAFASVSSTPADAKGDDGGWESAEDNSGSESDSYKHLAF